jgi:hypothetical protein
MANTYNFRINAVDVHTAVGDLEKVIYNVHWSYFAQDENGNRGSVIGVQSLEEPDPANFSNFETLVQSDIIAWIEPLLDVDLLKTRVDAIVAEKAAPTKQTLQVPISLVSEESTEETV